MAQLAWPKRFAVDITPVSGQGADATYTVMTWLHAEKAVAIATAAYLRRYPNGRIYDIAVRPLGRAPEGEHGTIEAGRGDLVDRYES